MPGIQQGRLTFVQIQGHAVEQLCLHGVLQHHHPACCRLLSHQEATCRSADFTFCGAYAKGPARIRGHLNHQLAVTQNQQPLPVIEPQVHGTVGVQAQAAAVSQVEVLALTTAGGQIGQQRITHRAARA